MPLTDTEPLEPELVDSRLDASQALMALNRSEIDQQIATAKRFPRSIVDFKRAATELACLDEETAETMFYVLPARRGSDKRIEGPSVRMAEVVGSSWGNLRYGARIVSIDDQFATAQGACFDLEKNISATVEIKRRITSRDGRRYSDDMIQTTCNAACSIALRQAIFKIVPFALVKPIYEKARLTSIGKAGSFDGNRQRAMEWFVKAGATQAQVLQAIGRKGIEDVTMEDLITLKGLQTAIKDGETTLVEALGPAPDPASRVRKSSLNDAPKTAPGRSDPAPQQTAPERSAEEPPRRAADETPEPGAATDGAVGSSGREPGDDGPIEDPEPGEDIPPGGDDRPLSEEALALEAKLHDAAITRAANAAILQEILASNLIPAEKEHLKGIAKANTDRLKGKK